VIVKAIHILIVVIVEVIPILKTYLEKIKKMYYNDKRYF